MISCGNIYINYKNQEDDDSCVCISIDALDVGGETYGIIESRALISAGVPLGGLFSYNDKLFFGELVLTLEPSSLWQNSYFYSITRLEDSTTTTPPPTSTTTPTPTTTCKPCLPAADPLPILPTLAPFTTRLISKLPMVTTTPPPISVLSEDIILTTTTTSTTSTTTGTTSLPTSILPISSKFCVTDSCNKLSF